MPSPKGSPKYIANRRKACGKYKKSVKGRARINATKKVWKQTAKGRASVVASTKKREQTAAYKAIQATKARKRKVERKKWLREIKSKLSCSECGFDKHPAALQFHHLRDKVASITWLVCNTNRPLDVIRAEMAKCVVLCANCHLILHDEEHNDRVRARDTTRGLLPSRRRNEPSPNRKSGTLKLDIRFGKDTISDGKPDAYNFDDNKGSHSTLCE